MGRGFKKQSTQGTRAKTPVTAVVSWLENPLRPGPSPVYPRAEAPREKSLPPRRADGLQLQVPGTTLGAEAQQTPSKAGSGLGSMALCLW